MLSDTLTQEAVGLGPLTVHNKPRDIQTIKLPFGDIFAIPIGPAYPKTAVFSCQ